MTQNCEEIKTLLDQLSTADITASARLIAVLESLGVTSARELQRLTGLSEAGVRKARKQLADSRTPVRAPECDRTRVAHQSAKSHQGSAPECETSSRARAYKESPSEIVNKKIKQQTTTRDLSSLNGSTDVVVGFVSSWMTAYYPDERDAAARTWIASEIARTSADAVKQAILLTANKLQRGEIVPKPLNYATHTATNLCKEAATAASTTGKAVTSLDRWKAKKALQNSEVAHG